MSSATVLNSHCILTASVSLLGLSASPAARADQIVPRRATDDMARNVVDTAMVVALRAGGSASEGADRSGSAHATCRIGRRVED